MQLFSVFKLAAPSDIFHLLPGSSHAAAVALCSSTHTHTHTLANICSHTDLFTSVSLKHTPCVADAVCQCLSVVRIRKVDSSDVLRQLSDAVSVQAVPLNTWRGFKPIRS